MYIYGGVSKKKIAKCLTELLITLHMNKFKLFRYSKYGHITLYNITIDLFWKSLSFGNL